MRRALPVLAAAVLVLTSHVALASANARLVYARSVEAASCPDEGALREAVTARVGYDPFFPWADRAVVASITKRGRAFVANVDVVDENSDPGLARRVRECVRRPFGERDAPFVLGRVHGVHHRPLVLTDYLHRGRRRRLYVCASDRS